MMLYLVPFVIVATTLSMSLVCKSLPIQDELVKKQQLTDSGCEQQEYACLLERNETVRREFEHSLRVKHGINNPSYNGFVAVTDASQDQNVPCRASCPTGSTMITWCVNVYHPEDDIEACFSDGVVINATEAAMRLNLSSHFDSQANSNGALQVKKLPLYFSNSYLTCTAQSNSQNCTEKTFTSLTVIVRNREEMPPNVSISSVSESNMTSQLIIGQTNVFLCVAEYSLSTTRPYHWQGWWQVNGVDQYDVINEDPFCDLANNMECSEDRLKDDRVRFYQLQQYKPECPIPTYVISNWMWIDNATKADSMQNFSCRVSYTSFPSVWLVERHSDLHLN